MRVIRLEAENFKRLKAVEITAEGDVVTIAGRNAQGKSSVLDAIWAALDGKGAKVSRPIREGENKARVEVDLGEIVVERKWSGARSSLEVRSAEGARFPSPQRMLDDLIGSLSFDPLAFAQMDEKSQVKTLIDLIDGDETRTFDDIALDRRNAYDERTNHNREVKRLQALLTEMPKAPENTPAHEIDVASLVHEIGQARDVESKRRELRAEYARLSEEVRRLQLRMAAIADEGKQLPPERDISALEIQLASADDINRQIAARTQRQQVEVALRNEELASLDLSTTIAELDREKANRIAAARLPVEGLSWDEEGVQYRGVPFRQASGAEQLRVSVAMAMALNPKVRVIRISDGSLLDSSNLELLTEMAADNDFQIWLERVDETGRLGITIEDGSILKEETRP